MDEEFAAIGAVTYQGAMRFGLADDLFRLIVRDLFAGDRKLKQSHAIAPIALIEPSCQFVAT
ncbi:hypothetical protein LB523_17925 [Mesorhizobium sp. ESP-6-4]|uniref:hypothetical protein n=1 Tax=Mesorhizobium sp. ESP-6-4 TaxID=2876624 RepID=UPI001CCD0036|nr:hypothetical protein [Mesorhizobium sp. ESP-6-4]MBZ9660927.1 hypothetical protein [Mesorhizobium sp. ESP-6-4]